MRECSKEGLTEGCLANGGQGPVEAGPWLFCVVGLRGWVVREGRRPPRRVRGGDGVWAGWSWRLGGSIRRGSAL